ncbi:MAG: CHAT domain-containing protein [Betaproteobacteria bacterium]|nr:CHAT domain-containing protein [Betaproteobacteria bacterium]
MRHFRSPSSRAGRVGRGGAVVKTVSRARVAHPLDVDHSEYATRKTRGGMLRAFGIREARPRRDRALFEEISMAGSNATIAVSVPGSPVSSPGLPRALAAGMRDAVAAGDPFLPAGFVAVLDAYDLARTGRDVAAAPAATMQVSAGEVLVLELDEGVSIITSPEHLRETLARLDPAGAESAALDLDTLRRQAEATRGWVGDAVGSLVRRVFRLRVGAVADPILDAARDKVAEWLGEKAEEKLHDLAQLGVTWLGTKALMWAIENRLQRAPGLYRWVGGHGDPADLVAVDDAHLEADARQGPLLVFIHGTGSNTAGSFGDLRNVAPDDWRSLQTKFGERVFAFEHRTFSESPIENALELARTLPSGARLNVVTHSRGGLVGDFLCLEQVDAALVAACFGEPDAPPGADTEQQAVTTARAAAYADHRARLAELAVVLREKRFVIQRYVRVASPARGTRLASANFDVFLSGLLSLIGMVPVLAGSPIYGAVKRVVLEVARNRTRPDVVPGIEAMLPDSPTAIFLARSAPRAGMDLAVIAGDIEGGGLLKKLGVLFTDYVFFDDVDNDLVVDTDSMYAGLARPAQAHSRFEQGPEVNHFRYFENTDSRAALLEWLTARDVTATSRFEPLPASPAERTVAREIQDDRDLLRTRGGDRALASLPVVVLLPGIMGSHLRLGSSNDRVWFDPVDLVRGGLRKLAWKDAGDDVVAEKLFDRSYGDLATHLLASHRVERFPYDWRKPVSAAADALADRVQALLDATRDSKVPIRFLAHSMGGLVVRTMIARRPDLWDAVNARDGCRFVMLGTPNQGSHSMVATLLGKDDTVRRLARFVDMRHDLQELLDIIKEFRGALQLLPRPGFVDVAGQDCQEPDYYADGVWEALRPLNRDFWFGNGVVGIPSPAALGEAAGIWAGAPDLAGARLPGKHGDRIVYVCGVAPRTPCGVDRTGGRLRMLACAEGDGTVTWRSGLIAGLEEGRNVYFMRAEHGALADTEEAFPALVDLLEHGETQRTAVLSRVRPAVRGATRVTPFEPGPVPYPSADEVADGLVGRRRPKRVRAVPKPVLQVGCFAMDLRQAVAPVMVGHYEQDAISGAEALIDRDVVTNELTMRNHLGLYAGRLGTATVVLQPRNEEEMRRGSSRGAVVVGLGRLGDLSVGTLTEAVRTGVLRYLLQVVDNGGGNRGSAGEIGEVALASLLLGHNSTTNISVEDSVGAIVRGVLEANREFAQTMKWPLRVTRLDLIELYLDTAIGATRALRRVADRLNAEVSRAGMRVAAAETLVQRPGWLHRLDAQQAGGYWPRMIVGDADVQAADCPPFDAAVPSASAAPAPQAYLAQRLRFLFLGQRARAESVVQQRQPGLVETLVAESITRTGYSEDFSRTLFQLLVPNDFKDVARQLDRIVLVVDPYTANLPWELMMADKEPLAVHTRMVRQFASGRFRTRVRQTLDRLAYVVGNPATRGFGQVFRTDDGRPYPDPPPLAGAETEARAVVQVLTRAGFQVAEAIGHETTALEVVNKLFQQPYRIVHVAAHGVVEQRAADGSLRTGAILSDGMLLGAAEIGSMEIVPDLVFLNCCHLARTDGPLPPTRFNRLAYSVARELIEMGVRAVIAAGWAVDDGAAEFFSSEFYTALMLDRKPLGEAAFEARRSTFARFGATTNTWGAYQVYGDPGYLVDPQGGESRGGRTRSTRGAPVVPDELIGALERVRDDAAGAPGSVTPEDAANLARRAGKLLADSPAAWSRRPDVNYALGQIHGALGVAYFEKARACFLDALRGTDKDHSVPTRAIEELANLEARVAEEREARGGAGMAGDPSLDPLELVESAIARLGFLTKIAGERSPFAEGDTDSGRSAGLNRERAILFGSTYKRKSAILAWRLLRGAAGASIAELDHALQQSAKAYRAASLEPDSPDYKPYIALNVVALETVLDAGRRRGGADDEAARLAEVRQCRTTAWSAYRINPDFWNAVMPADADVVEALVKGELGLAGDPGDRVLDAIRNTYAAALSGARATPRELDSVVRQLCLLSLFYRVRSIGPAGRARDHADLAARTSARLAVLANELVPDSCVPGDPSPDRSGAPIPALGDDQPAAAGRKGSTGGRTPARKPRAGGGTRKTRRQ